MEFCFAHLFDLVGCPHTSTHSIPRPTDGSHHCHHCIHQSPSTLDSGTRICAAWTPSGTHQLQMRESFLALLHSPPQHSAAVPLQLFHYLQADKRTSCTSSLPIENPGEDMMHQKKRRKEKKSYRTQVHIPQGRPLLQIFARRQSCHGPCKHWFRKHLKAVAGLVEVQHGIPPLLDSNS